jgi:hypothetical protein
MTSREPLGQLELLGDGDVGDLALGDSCEAGQVAVLVEEQVEFRRSLPVSRTSAAKRLRSTREKSWLKRLEVATLMAALPV